MLLPLGRTVTQSHARGFTPMYMSTDGDFLYRDSFGYQQNGSYVGLITLYSPPHAHTLNPNRSNLTGSVPRLRCACEGRKEGRKEKPEYVGTFVRWFCKDRRRGSASDRESKQRNQTRLQTRGTVEVCDIRLHPFRTRFKLEIAPNLHNKHGAVVASLYFWNEAAFKSNK